MSNSQFSQSNPLKNPSLTLVPLKGVMATKTNQSFLIQEIVNILKEIPNLNDMKGSLTLLDNICLLVENHSQKTKIDKKQAVISIIIQLFPEMNNESSLKKLSQDIDELVSISKYVKKIPFMKKSFKMLSSYVQKKL